MSSPLAVEEVTPPRFVVGIDLGTTNIAVAYVDTTAKRPRVTTFPIPQLVAPGLVEARDVLPAFHYEPAAGEIADGGLQLPWSRATETSAVGVWAREQGAVSPGRLIASAKSWLCHSGVDRAADLLPWHGAPDVARLSPVEASARYLQHLRGAWDHAHPDAPLAAQDVVLTLPASFDEIARELTVRAAARAGLPRIVLIEEPQAAFYAWIDAHARDWEQRVAPGQKILVCDVGGGTSDFTLIRVKQAGDGQIQFQRVAVGDHLILGGDNFDLALARRLEERLAGGGRLEPRQWAALIHAARNTKEQLLADDAPERLTVHVPGTGSRLIGGGSRINVTRDEVRELLVDGFFPCVDLHERPAAGQSGFREFGLPYAADAAVTRYLAAFLTAHRDVVARGAAPDGRDPVRPDVLLFNGGPFVSGVLRQRVLDVLARWFPEPGWRPVVLENERLDLAVARGAAYYGLVRRGIGVRIAAGLARTYYMGLDADPPAAVCLLPAGIEAGQEIALTDRTLELRISQPVEFPLWASSVRLTDQPGDVIPIDVNQLTALPPVRTVLQAGKRSGAAAVAVILHARLTEIGTLEMWCSAVEGARTWKLQFDVRSTTETDRTAHAALAEQEGFVDEATWEPCRRLISGTFGADGRDAPESLVKRLEAALDADRRKWPTSLLRRMWEALLEDEAGRARSPQHAARWLNLVGFALRPGVGLAADDWRVAETRRVLQGKTPHGTPDVRREMYVLWRRIAAGLTPGQQQALADPLIAGLRGAGRRLGSGQSRGAELGLNSPEAAEIWRMLGAFELLPPRTKLELGNLIVDLLVRKKSEAQRPALAGALARIGARTPLFGPLNGVLPPEQVAPWIAVLADLPAPDPAISLALMQLARRTDDRFRDVPDAVRQQALAALQAARAPAHFQELVQRGGALDAEERSQVFGEALPKGLRLG